MLPPRQPTIGELTTGLIIHGCSDGEKNECQQIYRYQRGDVGTRHAGEVGWGYNGSNGSNIAISILRVNDIGGLRIFSLGGPQNILDGFSSKFISNAFNIQPELAMKIQRKDPRGNTIYLTRGEIHLSNVIDASSCKTNNTRIATLVDPPEADHAIAKDGYFTTIDVDKFPILESVKFSASYNLMLKDVMRLPHWENSNRIVYVVKGEGLQMIMERAFVVKEGEILIVPKFLVMTEKAKSEMFEYIMFETNANPIT
ncbi:Glutelin type-B 2 [Euphorbia peplus]|nr:Glutelin type-B 2 [Euphorbia peplus]